MKLNSLLKRHDDAAALIAALIFALLASGIFATYLVLIQSENRSVIRSQSWNCALAYAEAGIDECLAQINAGNGSFAGNGWGSSTVNGVKIYGPVTRYLNSGYYVASIQISNGVMAVYSTGNTKVPNSDSKVSRKVKVVVANLGLLPVSFASVSGIQFNGNGIATDSFNSHDTNLSTSGLYDPSKTSTNGNVASVFGGVNIGNHTILGNLYLGPSATYNSSIGQVNGTIFYDYNVQFPDAKLPTDANGNAISWLPAPTTTTLDKKGNVDSATHLITTDGYYSISDVNFPGGIIEVAPGVNAYLNVTASAFNPASVIIHGGITNSGTARIYLNGPTSISIAGNTAIDASNRAENLWYYGLPTLTAVTFSGTSTFVGVIYAPQAALTLNGGGNNIGVVGSTITGHITMNGHYNFHYDESLGTNGSRGFIPLSWQEL